MAWATVHALRLNGVKIEYYRKCVDTEMVEGWEDHRLYIVNESPLAVKETFDQITTLIEEAKSKDVISGG